MAVLFSFFLVSLKGAVIYSGFPAVRIDQKAEKLLSLLHQGVQEHIEEGSVTMQLFRPSLNYPTYPYAEMLARTAERFPENVAVLFKEVSLTYRELNALASSFANALSALGVRKGQKVGLFMTNRPEYLISCFAIARIGAVMSPLNPSYKEREVAYQLENSEAVAVIVQQELLPLVNVVQEELPLLKLVIAVSSDKLPPLTEELVFDQLVRDHAPHLFEQPEIGPEDVVALPYSSGTTGLPKGVLLSHKNLVCNACQSIATARITSQDHMLVFLPLYHIYGIMLMGCAAMSGATLVLMERFETERCLQLIQEQSITILYTVPQVLVTLTAWPQLQDYDLHTVRFAQCGAAPVPPVVAHRFQEATHITVVTSYGLTEAAPGTHSNPVYDPRRIKLETVGLPIHDTEQKIVDIETGRIELGLGEEGELIVRGPQVMQGYWKAPQATADALRDGWLYTGDIGFLDAKDM